MNPERSRQKLALSAWDALKIRHQQTDREDLIVRQLRCTVGLSGMHSPLAHGVLSVLLERPQEQVIRPDTRRGVAVVEHLEVIGERAVRDLVRDPMRVPWPPVDVALAV